MSRRDGWIAVLAAILWGFNLTVGKIGVGIVPPLIFCALRFLIAAALIVPFYRIERHYWRDIFILSVCLGTGHFGLLFIGLEGVDSATAAIILQLGVPLSIILSWLVYKETFGWRRSCGMCLALMGIIYLAGEPHHVSFTYFIALIGCTFFWAWSNIIIKRLSNVNPFAIAGWLSFLATPQLLLLSLTFESGQVDAIMNGGWPLLVTLLYTAIAASIIAHGTWYGLIQRYPVNVVVPFGMLIPIIGVSAGLLILSEPLTLQKIIGGTLTLVGVGIIQWRLASQATAKRSYNGT
ncbi:MAG: DMT family transporter [Rhodospirillaceae bacterium]